MCGVGHLGRRPGRLRLPEQLEQFAVGQFGGTLGEFDEQARVLRVPEQPDALPPRFRKLAQLAERVHVFRLVLRGDAHSRRGQDFGHAHTAPSGNSCSSVLTSARNLSASAPSTTRWSYDIVSMPIVRMAIDSVPSDPATTLGRFSIAPTPRMATCG